MSEPNHIHIDLPAIEQKLGVGIRRVAAFMAIGLNASKVVTRESLELAHSEASIRFFPEEVGEEHITEAAREFRSWILTNGVQELCTFLEHYLGDLYMAAAWLSKSQDGMLSSGTTIPALPKDFTRKGLATKLSTLEREYGVVATNGHYLSTFWDARNCLSHRLGFVGEEDLKDGREALAVRWLGLDAWLTLKGEEPRLLPLDLGEGVHAPEGGTVEIRSVERVKEFRLGDRIDFNAQELSEILLTAKTVCEVLMQGVAAFAQAKGVVGRERVVPNQSPTTGTQEQTQDGETSS